MAIHIRRRELIVAVGAAAATWPLVARAQRQPAMPVIGSLQGVSATQWADRMIGFHQGLGEAGYVEGRNVAIEYRWAEGQYDRLPAIAVDLVNRRVAVIFAFADVGVQAAMAATKTIPIVFTTGSDPVAAGFVPSLGRPRGNITGITMMGVELVAKRLELLHELFPGAARIALLVNPNNPDITRDVILHTQDAARRFGLEIVVVEATTEREIESSIATAVQQQAAALSIGNDPYLSSHSRLIAFLALRHALPTMAFTREYVSAGILMSRQQSDGQPSTRRGVCWPHSQGRQAGEPSCRPADQVRAVHQPDHGKGSRHYVSAQPACRRRRGDRIGCVRTILLHLLTSGHVQVFDRRQR
jgi:putative ABC transport system substrate-binding protein